MIPILLPWQDKKDPLSLEIRQVRKAVGSPPRDPPVLRCPAPLPRLGYQKPLQRVYAQAHSTAGTRSKARCPRSGFLVSGQVAQVLALGFKKHGHDVMLGSRDPAKLAAWQAEKGAIALGDFAAAARHAEIVVLAVLGPGGRVAGAGRPGKTSLARWSSTPRTRWMRSRR